MLCASANDKYLNDSMKQPDSITDKILLKICNFAQIKFESEMLYPDTSKFNGIGGNRLIKYPIQRIKLDDAWKTEMPNIVRALTNLTVSSFNRRHGY